MLQRNNQSCFIGGGGRSNTSNQATAYITFIVYTPIEDMPFQIVLAFITRKIISLLIILGNISKPMCIYNKLRAFFTRTK